MGIDKARKREKYQHHQWELYRMQVNRRQNSHQLVKLRFSNKSTFTIICTMNLLHAFSHSIMMLFWIMIDQQMIPLRQLMIETFLNTLNSQIGFHNQWEQLMERSSWRKKEIWDLEDSKKFLTDFIPTSALDQNPLEMKSMSQQLLQKH